MKPIVSLFFLLLVFAGFSGDLNRSNFKCCNQQNLNSTSDRILVVVNAWTGMDQQLIESCMNGLEITFDLQSQSKIVDKITLENKPDTKVIKELQKKYSVTGLLFLSRLKMQKSAKDVPGNQIEYLDNRMPEPYLEIYERVLPWTNLFAEITSKWKYYDLNSGKQFDIKIKNNKAFELRKYVSDIDSLVSANPTLLEPLFYQNGKMAAEELLKIKD